MRPAIKPRDEVDRLEPPRGEWLTKTATAFGLPRDSLSDAVKDARKLYYLGKANYQLNEWDWELVRKLNSFQRKLERVANGVKRYQAKAHALLDEWNGFGSDDRDFLEFYNKHRLENQHGGIEENLKQFATQTQLTHPLDCALELLRSYHQERGADEGRPRVGDSGIPWVPIVYMWLGLVQFWKENKKNEAVVPRARGLGDDNAAFRFLLEVAQWIDNRHTDGDCKLAADSFAAALNEKNKLDVI